MNDDQREKLLEKIVALANTVEFQDEVKKKIEKEEEHFRTVQRSQKPSRTQYLKSYNL